MIIFIYRKKKRERENKKKTRERLGKKSAGANSDALEMDLFSIKTIQNKEVSFTFFTVSGGRLEGKTFGIGCKSFKLSEIALLHGNFIHIWTTVFLKMILSSSKS